MNLNGGSFRGRQVLDSATMRLMFTRQFPEFTHPLTTDWGGPGAGYGLTWWVGRENGHRAFAHSGSVPGYTAFVEGDLDRRLGVALLSNGHRAHPHLLRLAATALRLLSADSR